MTVTYAKPLTEQEQRKMTAARAAELNVFPELKDEDLRVARAFSCDHASDFPVCQAIVGLLVRVRELEQMLAATNRVLRELQLAAKEEK